MIAAAPIASPWIAAHADALLVAYFGGQATAAALVDVLAGAVSPSGRLPYSVPR